MSESSLHITLSDLLALRHRVGELHLFSTSSRRSPLIGLNHSKLGGRGVDFDQVRAYQNGDDVRSIDWRVTARTQEPHTKLFQEERERPVFLLVEQSPRLFFGSQRCVKAVMAAQAAALFGWSALAHNDRIGGLVFGTGPLQHVRPQRSKQSLLRLLNLLVTANQHLQTAQDALSDSLTPALLRSREALRPGSLVTLICDERSLTPAAREQLGLMARHLDLILLPLSDPLDHELPEGVLDFVQGGQQLRLEMHAEMRGAYAERARRRQADWQRLAQELRLLLLPLSTHEPLLDQLRAQVLREAAHV